MGVERSSEMERSPLSFVFLLLFTVARTGEGVKFPPTSKSSMAGLILNRSVQREGGNCSLPLGRSGTVKLLEDCETLGRYLIPIPGISSSVHSVVCCPDGSANTQGLARDGYEEDYFEEYEDFFESSIQIPTMYGPLYNRSCDAFWLGNFSFENSSADCVPITRCPALLNSTLAPSRSAVCGFDEESQLLMVCCPADQVTEPQDLSQPPLYPSPSGEARKVEDKSDLCFDWSINEEACLLYRHFPKGKVTSRDMFDFMQRTCPGTCGWVESGCHDSLGEIGFDSKIEEKNSKYWGEIYKMT